jgi:cytochrome o ubiquinol oxidase subunit 1
LFLVGVALMNISLGVGEFAQTGWLAYPPLSGKQFSPGVGVDYWIWSLQISGIGTLLTGVKLLRHHSENACPGHEDDADAGLYLDALCTNVLIIISFPILTATVALLTLDRYIGTHFFTNEMGGNQMMYVNLIWPGGIRRCIS